MGVYLNMKKSELIGLLKAISFIDGRVRYVNSIGKDEELYKQIDFICETILSHLNQEDKKESVYEPLNDTLTN
jgi:hypothetical protein